MASQIMAPLAVGKVVVVVVVVIIIIIIITLGEMVQVALVFRMHQKFRAGPREIAKKSPRSLIKLVSWVRFFLDQSPLYLAIFPRSIVASPGFVSFLHQDWWVLSESSDSIPVKLQVWIVGGVEGWVHQPTGVTG